MPGRIRTLSYGFEVWCGHPTPDPDVALVIIQEEDQKLFWCCRCGAHSCGHTKAVLHHVIDQESR